MDDRRRSSIVKTSASGISTPSRPSNGDDFQFLGQPVGNDSQPSSDLFIDAMDDSRVHNVFEYVFSTGALLTMIKPKTNTFVPVMISIRGPSIFIEKVDDSKFKKNENRGVGENNNGNSTVGDDDEYDNEDINSSTNSSAAMSVFSKFSPVKLFSSKKKSIVESEVGKSDNSGFSKATTDTDVKKCKYPNVDLDRVRSFSISVHNITNLLWNHVIFTIDFNPGPIGLETEVRSNKLGVTNILKKSQADAYRDILLNSQVIFVRDVYISTLASFKDEVLKSQNLANIRVKFIIKKDLVCKYEMKKNNTEYYDSDIINNITIVFKEFNKKRDPTLVTGHNYVEIGCNSVEERDAISVGMARLIVNCVYDSLIKQSC